MEAGHYRHSSSGRMNGDSAWVRARTAINSFLNKENNVGIQVGQATIQRVQTYPTIVRSESEHSPSYTKENAWECLKFTEMQTREDDIQKAVTGSCDWILKHKQFSQWKESTSGFLALQGQAGTGKSTLVKFLSLACAQQSRYSLKQVTCASFFFNYTTVPSPQATIMGLFRSVLHQILIEKPSLRKRFYTDLKKIHQKISRGGEWKSEDQESLQNLFRHSVIECEGIGKLSSLCIFIDALDECLEDTRPLLQFFRGLISEGRNLKICLSCRHNVTISFPTNFICIENNNRPGIEAYINACIHNADIVGSRDALIQKAQNSFQYLKTVIPNNENSVRFSPLNSLSNLPFSDHPTLGNLPLSLDSAYHELLLKAMKDARGNSQISKAAVHMMDLVGSAVRPLSPMELMCAIGSFATYPLTYHQSTIQDLCTSKTAELDMDCDIRRASGGLIEIKPHGPRRNTQLAHSSVVDFVRNDRLKRVLGAFLSPVSQYDPLPGPESIDVKEAHFRFAKLCIKYVMMAGADKDKRYNWPFLEYSTTNWIQHAQLAEEEGSDLWDMFEWFGNAGFGLWVHEYQKLGGRAVPDPGTTLLHIAARYNLRTVVKRVLIGKNVPLNKTDSQGRTPLSWAAQEGNLAIISALIDNGAMAESTDDFGHAPFYYAVFAGHKETARYLCKFGSINDVVRKMLDPYDEIIDLIGLESVDKDGRNMLSCAVEQGHDSVASLLARCDNVNERDHDGRTPIFYAASHGRHRIVSRLFQKGATQKLIDKFNRAPKDYAKLWNHRDVMTVLAEHDLDIFVNGDSRSDQNREVEIAQEEWIVAEDNLAAGDSVSIADDTAVIAEDSVFIADNTAVITEDSVFIADDTAVIAEDSVFIADETAVIAEDSVFIAEDTAIAVEYTAVVVEDTPAGPDLRMEGYFEPIEDVTVEEGDAMPTVDERVDDRQRTDSFPTPMVGDSVETRDNNSGNYKATTGSRKSTKNVNPRGSDGDDVIWWVSVFGLVLLLL